ncbi:RNA polymerase sigma factor SigJ [Actinomadura atramentaria]|uniref:RNA polymerase sigma factor SigJ n=1 Tax=Actinomadura atramentaria TaxID=1990 RepID=UPI00035C7D58|nr:RNA polymerase sigma factor SigJ [Actinomadura atramentaria]
MNAAEEFERHRPMLLGLAYRLLGSMWDAEDVVQDAYPRFAGAADVREPRALLVTIVTRLALDQLRSARVTREAYHGPWLPEPVDAAAFGPQETAELRDSLSYATLHLMERLSPPERAVVVLRDAFALPYPEIADIVGATVEACRQLHHRASRRLTEPGRRFRPDPAEHRRLLERLLDAAAGGDLAALSDLLAEDVVVYNDGGGKVRAAPRPVRGRAKALRFLAGLLDRWGLGDVEIVEANGEPAVRVGMADGEQIVAIGVSGGRVTALFAVLNPDKLGRV